ncbi:MAG: hypothetical protein E6I93_09275 [Chloroflexi bacterium]|nr:MAG: hypothetical protein E6I93_09275 [Chloroflexota bacterium]
MNRENQTISGKRSRWLRAALLTYTLASPAIRAWLGRMRKRSQSASVETIQEPEQTSAQAKQAELRDRLQELTQESRQRVVEQVKHLRTQAGQLRSQSRQLRKAVRNEAKQRRRLLVQLRKAGIDLGQDMLKRGEHLSEELIERGEKVSHDLVKRSEKAAQELARRSENIAQAVADKLTRKLAKRGRKMTRDLAERGEEWLKPERKQKRAIWMAAGFSVGLVVAGVINYRLVRGRAIQILEEGEESIELPQNDAWNGTPGRPVGEILHLDVSGTGVATLEVIDVTSAESSERPADAAFVGVVNTNYYYPIDTDTALDSANVVYFITEEEAREQGFKAAE